MRVSTEFPPNYAAVKERFNPSRTAIFTYGDTIYNPSGGVLTPELLAHEAVHERQQGRDPQAWWDRYMVDDQFRLEQELEAHRVEYQAFCARVKDRNRRAVFLNQIAVRLASGMYGRVVSPREAARLISDQSRPAKVSLPDAVQPPQPA